MLAHVYFVKWQQFLRHFTGYPEIILGQLDAEGHFELKAGNMSRDKASHPHNLRTMIRCHETSRKVWNHIVHCIFLNMKNIQVEEHTEATLRQDFVALHGLVVLFSCVWHWTVSYTLFWCSVWTDTEYVCAYHRGHDPQLHVAFPCSPTTLTPLFCCLRFHIWGTKNKILR